MMDKAESMIAEATESAAKKRKADAASLSTCRGSVAGFSCRFWIMATMVSKEKGRTFEFASRAALPSS